MSMVFYPHHHKLLALFYSYLINKIIFLLFSKQEVAPLFLLISMI